MDNKDNEIIRLDQDESGIVNSPEENEGSHYSHGDHHHHSHHHHHSRKRRNSKKEKAKRFLKRNKYKIANIFVTVLFISILAALGFMLDKHGFSKKDDSSSPSVSTGVEITDSTLQLEIPLFKNDIVLVSPAVAKYMESDISVSASDVYDYYAALGRLDTGLPVTLWYSIKGIPSGYTVRSAELFVSENSDFKSPLVFSLSGDETSVDVYNLKTNKQYYYRFVLSISNGSKTSVDGNFKTANTPRMLSIDGVGNIRDIGGWKTLDGKTVRQGLLYRSTELDGAVDSKYTATSSGINTLLTVLGIRTDMDLRYESENKNGTHALGAGVEHTYYNSGMYSDIFTDAGKTATRKIFSDLADESNYPVLIHCTHGMDRTGTICYLLEALLGVSEDDLMRDYQLSAFYHGSWWSLDQMNEFIGRLKSYEGSNMQEKAESYLLSIGVTPAEIASIREIYLEG